MRRFLIGLLAVLPAVVSQADTVSVEEAVTAAENWVAGGEALGLPLSGTAVGAQTYRNAPSDNTVHVVSFAGGGYVVTSSDTRLEPILAFSETGIFNAAPGSPFADLLAADVRSRQTAAETGSAAFAGIRLLSAAIDTALPDDSLANEEKWSRLLNGKRAAIMAFAPANGKTSVSNVKVSPLVKSKWDQEDAAAGHCYNYYTPNHYMCGCVATAMAQIMRYHVYPTGNVTAQKKLCAVDGRSKYLTMMGGTYDWANMPLNPSSANSGQRQAIGKLTYDCGVAACMDYSAYGSGAYLSDAVSAFKNVFGYYNAVCVDYPRITSFHNYVTNDLHRSLPAMVGIYSTHDSGDGHAVVVDGYGFSSGSLYYHLNMGWSGQDNLWYNLPSVSGKDFYFNAIFSLAYNIMPEKMQTVRVVQSGGDANCSVSGGGDFRIGSGVGVKASASAGYAFAGWYLDSTLATPADLSPTDYRNGSYSFTMPKYNLTLYARFIATDADTSISLGNVGAMYVVDDGTEIALDVNSLTLPKVSVKGLPSGMKFNAATLTISGRPSKPGVYTITVSMTNATVKKTVTETITIKVPNLVDELIPVQDLYGPFIPGVNYTNTILEAAGCTVTGLPSGMKWTAKNILNAKTKTVAVPAGSVYGAPTKPGYYTVYFTKTVDKIKHTATATFKIGPFPQVAVTVGSSDSNASAGVVTGAGGYAANKKVYLRATAAKGYVFAGWKGDSIAFDGDRRQPSFSFRMPTNDVELAAEFVTIAEDSSPILLRENGDALDEYVWDVRSGETNPDSGDTGIENLSLAFFVDSISLPGKITLKGLPTGIATESSEGYSRLYVPDEGKLKPGLYTVKAVAKNRSKAEASAAFKIAVPNLTAANECFAAPPDTDGVYGLSVGVEDAALLPTLELNNPSALLSVRGLPTGLKYDSKTGTITGVPTKSGFYMVYLTVTDAGRQLVSTISMSVEELPIWAAGTFNGGGDDGQATLTVAKSGRISGKWLSGGKTWALSAASFAAGGTDAGVYSAPVVFKSGNLAFLETVVISSGPVGGIATVGDGIFTAYQNNWTIEPWKSIAKEMYGSVYTRDAVDADGNPGVVSVRFQSAGNVAVTAKFTVRSNGKESVYSASGSAVWCAKDAATGAVFVYLPPKTGKFGGCVMCIDLPLY